jgi:hypothetical protein
MSPSRLFNANTSLVDTREIALLLVVTTRLGRVVHAKREMACPDKPGNDG